MFFMSSEDKQEQDRKYQRARYPISKSIQIARKTRVYRERRIWIDALKKGPCADCKNQFPPAAMTFDHVRGRKIKKISQMLASYSKETILAEIAKCELVCANCHAIRSEKLWSENNKWFHGTEGL